MSDSSCLTCNSTACNCANDIEACVIACKSKRLTNDKLKSFKTEVIVYISAVDCNFT